MNQEEKFNNLRNVVHYLRKISRCVTNDYKLFDISAKRLIMDHFKIVGSAYDIYIRLTFDFDKRLWQMSSNYEGMVSTPIDDYLDPLHEAMMIELQSVIFSENDSLCREHRNRLKNIEKLLKKTVIQEHFNINKIDIKIS